MTILLLEDDSTIASGLIYVFEQEGYHVIHCTTISQMENIQEDLGLAIIDLGLPDGTGFDAVGLLSCPFLFLTAVDDEANIVHGFDLGADDYITKPFRIRELLARVKMIIRRGGDGSNIITIRDIAIDSANAKVTKSGVEIELTALEYKLLLIFARNKGQMLTRKQLLDALWDHAGNFVEDNTLTVYIKRLREKLGADVIETARGLGYRCS